MNGLIQIVFQINVIPKFQNWSQDEKVARDYSEDSSSF